MSIKVPRFSLRYGIVAVLCVAGIAYASVAGYSKWQDAGEPSAKPPSPINTWAQTSKETRWQDSIDAFVRADREHGPKQGGIVFVGSSTIRFWDTLAEQFSDLPIVRRGFGGSRMIDCERYVDALVTPYKPKMVVVYAGDNDLNEGATAQDVVQSFKAFSSKIRKELPDARIAFVSIKPSPSRPNIMDSSRQANDEIKRFTETEPNMDFIDTFSAMLDENGHPRREYFKADDLHMNSKGYALWKKVVGPHLVRSTTPLASDEPKRKPHS